MANINAFYPDRLKGWALGLNAGGGNLGVPVVQLVGLLVLATAGVTHPRLILAVYIPLIVVAAVGAALVMDNLTTARNQPRAMREATREPHTWIMSFLYIGTFGSFIGFGFAFGQVLQNQFTESFATPLAAASLTWLGPAARLADPPGRRQRWPTGSAAPGSPAGTSSRWRVGAAVVWTASQLESLPLFVVGFVLLFVLSGIGNGSTYKMIPAIFRSQALQAVADGGDADGGRPAGAADVRRAHRHRRRDRRVRRRAGQPGVPAVVPDDRHAATPPTWCSSPSTWSASPSPGSSTCARRRCTPSDEGPHPSHRSHARGEPLDGATRPRTLGAVSWTMIARQRTLVLEVSWRAISSVQASIAAQSRKSPDRRPANRKAIRWNGGRSAASRAPRKKR